MAWPTNLSKSEPRKLNPGSLSRERERERRRECVFATEIGGGVKADRFAEERKLRE